MSVKTSRNRLSLCIEGYIGVVGVAVQALFDRLCGVEGGEGVYIERSVGDVVQYSAVAQAVCAGGSERRRRERMMGCVRTTGVRRGGGTQSRNGKASRPARSGPCGGAAGERHIASCVRVGTQKRNVRNDMARVCGACSVCRVSILEKSLLIAVLVTRLSKSTCPSTNCVETNGRLSLSLAL